MTRRTATAQATSSAPALPCDTMPMTRTAAQAFEVTIDFRRHGDWEQWLLLTADHHWDNPHCNRDLLKQHLDEAVARGAPIWSFGDAFCAMQGRYDPRRDPSDVRPEHRVRNYLDALVNTRAEWWQPYAGYLQFESCGNHELAIERHCETSLGERFAAVHNLTGGSVTTGPYAGWIRVRFRDRGTSRGSHTQSVTIAYDHGSGGGGPVTKGVIQTNRRSVYLPDADIMLTGHIHEAWQLEVERERLSESGKPYLDTLLHVQLATYKEERLDPGGSGFHVERGRPPKPLGGWWLRFYWSRARERVHYQVIRTER